MKHPVFIKLSAIALVVILLLTGLGFIDDVVRDRQVYRSEAVRSVVQSLAGPQTLMGPLLHSACVESWDRTTGSGATRNVTEHRREFMLTAFPERLDVKTSVARETLARGVHQVGTFTLKAHVTAVWPQLTSLAARSTVQGSRMQCGAPILMVAVADARGIRTAQLDVDGKALTLKPGTFHPRYTRGLHTQLPDNLRNSTTPLQATLDLELVGTDRLAVVPLGDTTDVRMQSAWPHPSFGGRFLPSDRDVTPEGFNAHWRLSSLASTAQQDVRRGRAICSAGYGDDSDATGSDNAAEDPLAQAVAVVPEQASTSPPSGCTDSFSVSFIDPVNPYVLSNRAAKYGVLFIALTFVAVGLFEIMARRRVHPVQYLLVGSALCSFFLLLVSLSEHFSFGMAYSVAAAACVLLLTYYASHMLGSVRRGLPLGLGIALLYGLLYVLLQLEQTALVVGAIALFLVLGAVMVATRKVNWYAMGQRTPPTEGSTP